MTTVRSEQEISAVRDMVWEFFDVLRERYPEMVDVIDDYITSHDVAGELDRFEDTFLPPKGECFLGLHDEAPAGIVMLKPHGDTDGELNRMYVRETARGQGLGRMLAKAAIAESRSRGHGTLWLDGYYKHVEAKPLYESLGFEYHSEPDAYGAGDARVFNMKLVHGGRA